MENNKIDYAGFWIRLVAYLIDFAFIYLIGKILSGILISIYSDPSMLIGVAYLCGIISTWLYFAFMESSNLQATMGKLIVGIKVMDGKYRKISF